MTAIVGLVHNGAVWLAGDRCVTAGTAVVPSATPKVWRSGDLLIGCAGDQSWLAAWRAEFRPSEDAWAPDDPLHWLTVEGVQAVRRRMGDWGQIGKTSDGAELCDGTAIVGYAGRLYEINGAGMSVIECAESVAGVGCGANIAIGAVCGQMACTDQQRRQPANILRVAMEASRMFCAYVRAPFDVVSTEARG